MSIAGNAAVPLQPIGATPAGPATSFGAAWRWGIAVLAIVCPVQVEAHPVLMTYIHRQFEVLVDPRNIDVVVTLTFHEIRSLAERRRMDADHDGRITPEEIAVYLEGLSGELEAGLELTIDDRPVTVLPLYDPVVDLLGEAGIAPAHHVLRLAYFARTPPWLRPGAGIQLHPRLWEQAPTLTFIHAQGQGGVRVLADAIPDPVRAMPAEQGEDVLKMTCLDVPGSMQADDREPDVAGTEDRTTGLKPVSGALAGGTPAPRVGTPAPRVGTPAPPVGTSAAPVETPAQRGWAVGGGLALAGLVVLTLRRRVDRV